jgi:hypothetical protein
VAFVVGLTAAAACQKSTPTAGDEPTDAYAKDIATVCNVVAVPEIANLPPGDETIAIAQYLGSHIKTREAREFLARTNSLADVPHAKALEDEARRVGATGECPLATRLRNRGR